MKCLSSWILAANVAAAFIAINGRGAAGAGTEEQVFPRDSLNNGTSGDGDTKVLEDLRARYHLPALAVGVSRAGNFTGKVVGVRKQGEPVPVQLTDQFHLGSNTKAMTATLAGMFIEQNRGFRWNTTLPEALPHLARNMSDGHRNTTIAMLTSHRSGIIDDWINDTVFANSLRDPTLAPSQARLLWINRILSKAPAAKTGTFHYDNTNYIIVGAIIEHFAGANASWESLITAHLFQPLNMTCGFGTPTQSSLTSIDNPWGHTFPPTNDSESPPTPVGGPFIQRDNPPGLGPAGTVHCSMSSYANFLQLHLDGFHSLPNALNLSASTFQKLHTPYPAPNTSTQYTYGGWGYGKETQALWARGITLSHAGSNTYNYAIAYLAPGLGERGSALMILTNEYGVLATQGTDMALQQFIRGNLLASNVSNGRVSETNGSARSLAYSWGMGIARSLAPIITVLVGLVII